MGPPTASAVSVNEADAVMTLGCVVEIVSVPFAVEEATVPASPLLIVEDPVPRMGVLVSEITVPSGMFVAASVTGTAAGEADGSRTAGFVYEPVGGGGVGKRPKEGM